MTKSINMNTDNLIAREQLVKKICAELNNFVDLKHTLITIINELKELTGFGAISIRLHKEDDYPYFVYEGFTDTFIKEENSICAHSSSNGVSNGSKTNPECLCGNVITGSIDLSQTYYTPKGSYWTNNSTSTGKQLDQNERNSKIRNYCNAAGYESIGLFPIKTREENIGLIQLNDKRTNMFSEDIIEYLEMIGEQIGIAIENAILYEKLKNKNTELENTLNDLGNMQHQLMEAKKMTALADLVTGVAHEVYHPVSDSLNMLESILSRTKAIESETNGIDELVSDEKAVYELLSNAKALIKSFRSIAFDQFQESRHLINIHSFLNDIIRVIKPSLKKPDVDFVIECAQVSEIMGFTGILSQVVTILIQNACTHGFKDETRGMITLGCGIVNEDTIELTVTDNGSGIHENIQHKLFEPFFSTEKKEHSGLGLHLAKNLIENKLKGKILLDTDYKGGARFILQIPA